MSDSLVLPAAPARWMVEVAEAPVELSVVVPSFNERDNIQPLVDALAAALDGIAWELVVVDDDSPDGTAEVVRAIARQDRRVRCLRRVGRRGLSSACIEGALASAGTFIAVMDADMQHDETLLPRMLAVLREGEAEIVVGSRYAQGGSVGIWDERRQSISRLATRLGRSVLRSDLSDPMSGFFMLRRDAFEAALPRLSGLGFKILLDLFASAPRPLRFVELPFGFRPRRSGVSKLDSQVAWDFLMLLLDKKIGRFVPVRFVAFALVGSLGVLVHLAVFALLYEGLQAGFVLSQSAATLVAMTSNYALNNALTYRDRRLRGWAWLRGLASFVLACSIGAVANVGVAAHLYQGADFWLLPAIAGILVGVVWNYAVTAVYTWRDSGRPASS
jgi:dolichol-phosphate mannosyltransferase